MKFVKVIQPPPMAPGQKRGRPRIFTFWWANWRAAVLDAFPMTFPTFFDTGVAVEDDFDVRGSEKPAPATPPRF